MDFNQLILTKNECYLAGGKLTPQGIMVHSTGAPNAYLKRYVGPDDGRLGRNQYNNHWNQLRPEGRQICCHAFVGKLENGSVATYQTLPWTMRGWHGGGTVNNTHIGFEICEDDRKDRAYLRAVFREAAELCAYLCKLFRLDPMKDGVIIDHAEGYRRRIASNHGDVAHWFPLHGESMDTFRAAVRREMEGAGEIVPPQPVWLPAVGDVVRFRDGRTTYYPGGPAFAASIRTGDPHVITKVDSGGKQVVYGGARCVLLGERVNLSTGRKSAGVNTWAAVEFLERVQGAAVMAAQEEEVA